MIDTLAILLTCAACIYVAFQAVRLDNLLPWFTPRAKRDETPPLPPQEAPREETPPRTGWRARARPQGR